jgi:hypothetical protein
MEFLKNPRSHLEKERITYAKNSSIIVQLDKDQQRAFIITAFVEASI